MVARAYYEVYVAVVFCGVDVEVAWFWGDVGAGEGGAAGFIDEGEEESSFRLNDARLLSAGLGGEGDNLRWIVVARERLGKLPGFVRKGA